MSAPVQLGEIFVDILAKDDQAGTALSSFAEKVGKTFANLTSKLGGLFGGGAAGGEIKIGVGDVMKAQAEHARLTEALKEQAREIEIAKVAMEHYANSIGNASTITASGKDHFVGLAKTVADAEEKFKGLATDVEKAAQKQAALQASLTGTQKALGLLGTIAKVAIIDGLGKAQQALSGLFSGASDMMHKAAEMANPAAYERLQASINGLYFVIGQKFVPIIEKMGEAVRIVSGHFSNISGEAQTSFASIVAGITATGAALTALISTLIVVKTLMMGVNLLGGGLPAILGLVAGVLGAGMVGGMAAKAAKGASGGGDTGGYAEKFSGIIQTVGASFERMAPTLSSIADQFARIGEAVLPQLLRALEVLAPAIEKVIKLVAGTVETQFTILDKAGKGWGLAFEKMGLKAEGSTMGTGEFGPGGKYAGGVGQKPPQGPMVFSRQASFIRPDDSWKQVQIAAMRVGKKAEDKTAENTGSILAATLVGNSALKAIKKVIEKNKAELGVMQ